MASEDTQFKKGQQPRLSHGHSIRGKHSPTYNSWASMLQRCKSKPHYVEQGISVCKRWSSFENFLQDLGDRPDGTTLDRYPNFKGNYEPSNVRWATKKQQANNRQKRRWKVKPMLNIDDYGQFTEDIWFSKHQADCNTFLRDIGVGALCNCDQDPERSLTIMTLGLAGETGEVMEILKKRIRDATFDKENLIKELGDVAYYWARICRHFGIQPSQVLETNRTKLLSRKARGVMRGSGDNR